MREPGTDEIVVVGETLIDIVRSGDDAIEHVGGSPANVALTLGRLGRATRLITQLGDDGHGRLAREHLERSGVRVDATVTGRTSTAIATIGPDGSAEYAFDIRWGPQHAPIERATHVHA